MSRRHAMALLTAAALSTVLAGCGSSSDEKETPLSGRRISVLSFEQSLTADPQVDDIRISLPQPYRNFDWPQSGGSAAKAMHHLEVGERLSPLWRAAIGSGSSSTTRLVNPPVVAEGMLYVVDTDAVVSAFNANSGDRIWRYQIDVKKEKKAVAFGGGVAVGDGRLYVTTGYGIIAALDAVSGREIWRDNFIIPFRGAPSYVDGRVFAVTQDNQLVAYAAEDGAFLWDHVGIAESAGIMGTAAPAIVGDTVVAAFSSGEVVAFRAENGRVAWSDTLSRSGRITALAALSDVDGDPVIDRGTVFAISHAGRMAAIDFASGSRLWENNLGGIATPWVAGDFIYVVTADSEVVCIMRRDGRVRWVKQLQRFTEPDERKGIIKWSGPVLASDRLFVTSSHGFVLTLSPYTGEVLSGERLSDGAFVPPIVANGTLYVLTDDGRIAAYR